MIVTWMLFTLAIGLSLSAAAAAADRIASALGRPTRFVWLAVIVASAAWPCVAMLAGRGAPAPLGASSAALAPFTIGLGGVGDAIARVSGGALGAQLGTILLVAWGALTTVLLVRLVRALRSFARQCVAWPARSIEGVRIRVSTDVGPAVLGLDPMEIVLPEWTLALDQPLRAMVLHHEEEHRLARDPYLLLAAATAVALMPWNAALWWQARRLRLAIETDCDARVLGAHPHPERYGLLLLTIAQRRAASASLFAPALSEPTSHLERRIIAMRRPLTPVSRLRLLKLGAAAVVAGAVACSVDAPDKPTSPRDRAAAIPASGSRVVAPNLSARTDANGGALFEFQVEKPVTAVGGPTPRYPAALRSAHVQGDVQAQYVVDTAGHPEMSTFKVLKSSDPLFNEAVKEALAGWRFEPAEVGGRKVKQLVQQTFKFAAK
ncbi:MAG: M56 family metallopeptidase [Gemmatimonadaceae bacterium]